MSLDVVKAGDRFGRLVWEGHKWWNGRATVYAFRCDCGSLINRTKYQVKINKSKSCGCLKREQWESAKLKRKQSKVYRMEMHGWRNTPEYLVWQAMKARCHRKSHKAWDNYGGRGISVCEEWRQSFTSFIKCVGPRPSPEYSLDRIDNDRNYEPGNVRWATRSEQAKNRRQKPRMKDGTFAPRPVSLATSSAGPCY